MSSAAQAGGCSPVTDTHTRSRAHTCSAQTFSAARETRPGIQPLPTCRHSDSARLACVRTVDQYRLVCTFSSVALHETREKGPPLRFLTSHQRLGRNGVRNRTCANSHACDACAFAHLRKGCGWGVYVEPRSPCSVCAVSTSGCVSSFAG